MVYVYQEISCYIGEETKNEHALRIALEILNTAVWINAHILPVKNNLNCSHELACIYLSVCSMMCKSLKSEMKKAMV